MNRSPFKWTTSWPGILLTDDNLLLPNTWEFSLEYDVISDEITHRDIAMQRLEFMVDEKFYGATWMNFTNPLVGIFHENLNNFTITVPSDPHDSIIAAAAILKAQSITKDVFEIHRCSIKGKLGYSLENTIEIDEAEEMGQVFDHEYFADGPWFMREDAGFTDLLSKKDDTVTLIKDSVPWSKFDLNWDYYDQEQPQSASLININKHERWIPMVIKGGANNNDDS